MNSAQIKTAECKTMPMETSNHHLPQSSALAKPLADGRGVRYMFKSAVK
jgi:hypothetical protein